MNTHTGGPRCFNATKTCPGEAAGGGGRKGDGAEGRGKGEGGGRKAGHDASILLKPT